MNSGPSLVGLGLGVFSTVFLRTAFRSPASSGHVHLTPIVIASTEILLPDGAQGSDAGHSASWAPAVARNTRCGFVARANVFASRMDLPDGMHVCGTYNSFAGGSSDGPREQLRPEPVRQHYRERTSAEFALKVTARRLRTRLGGRSGMARHVQATPDHDPGTRRPTVY